MGAVCSCDQPMPKGDNNQPKGDNNANSKSKVQPSSNGEGQEQEERNSVANDAGQAFLIGLLKDIPLLNKLKQTELDALSRQLVEKSFEPKEDIMKQGQSGDDFFIITSGHCEVLVECDGKTNKVAELGKGDYCGEQALISDSVRTATIRPTEETTCLSLSRKGFNTILKDSNIRFAKRNNKRIAIQMENLADFKIDESKDTEKSEQEILWLLDCVQENLLFETLTSDQQRALVKYMYKEEVEAETKLIVQGDEGRTFYVVIEGEFDIIVDGVGKVDSLTSGACTGDLALLYNAPRSATVQATTCAKVWVTERSTFRKVLMEHEKKKTTQNMEFLRNVELLQPLTFEERALVDQSLQESSFKKGEVVFSQGDSGDKFYIIAKGICECQITNAESGEKETFTLDKPGDFFGERALLTDEPRAATVVVMEEDTRCLWLDRNNFKELLGPLEDIMNRNIEEYEKPPSERNLIGRDSHIDEVCALEELKVIGILGKGAFGTVSLVVDPNTKKSYALKAIRKIQVVELGHQTHIVNEKKIMQLFKNDFLVNLCATYKDKWRVYLLLDVCLGGELFTILRKRRSFDEPTARFFAACVIEAFDYMHSLHIIYRDLKPENLVMDSSGYIKVADFGFAKYVPNKTFTMCGTPDYLAPEIVTGQGHGRGVDWWTLGVLIFEMLSSFPPFFDEEPMVTYRKIISCRFKFAKWMSVESKDLITRLLRVRPTKRLGVIKGGPKLIKKHEWFEGFKWKALVDKSMIPPIVPNVKDEDDISNFEQFKPEEEKLEFDTSRVDLSWDSEF